MKIVKKEDYLTNTPKKEKVTIENGNRFPNLKNVAGDSVDEHKSLEKLISPPLLKMKLDNKMKIYSFNFIQQKSSTSMVGG